MSSSASKETKDLFTCTAHRRLTGIEFQLQSEPIEAAFRLLSDGRSSSPRASTTNPGWGPGIARYELEMAANGIPVALAGYNKGRFDLWGHRELIHSRAPSFNLAPLLAVGLGTGVTLTVPTVMSNTQMAQYLDGLKIAVRQFFIDYLADRTRSIRLTTEEVE